LGVVTIRFHQRYNPRSMHVVWKVTQKQRSSFEYVASLDRKLCEIIELPFRFPYPVIKRITEIRKHYIHIDINNLQRDQLEASSFSIYYLLAQNTHSQTMQRLGSTQSQHTSLINIYKTIYDLPPDVLRLVFTFLGIGYFRFVGGTSRIFRERYLSTSLGADSRTTIENVVSSVSCVELYLQEAGTDLAQLHVILNGAASYGRLDILEWAHERGYSHACSIATSTSAVDERTCSSAALGGRLNILQWLRANGCPCDERTCSSAAEGGHLNILQWLRANGCPWDKWTCSRAAEGGHLNILQWARANGCSWDEYTCSYAALGGHLNILQWARANGCPWDEYTCSCAADGGHLNILQWLEANECDWDERTCSSAAGSGHLNILQWLRANGCPWDERTCFSAVSCGHLNILKWACDNGCPRGL